MSITIPSGSTIASRLTGVAPLSVHFDASGVTSTATSFPFHECIYVWDFGDPVGATWRFGINPNGNNRNQAYGPEVAHVFETFGTYTVKLSVLDSAGTLATLNITITVDDPASTFSGTNTICFATDGVFTGVPTGALTVTTSNFTTAINNNVGTGKRLLFKRGQTFTSSGPGVVTVTGPGHIGVWGTGTSQAIVNRSTGTNMLTFGGQNFPNSTFHLKDWRIADLSMNGGAAAECINLDGGFDQVTFLRITATNGGDTLIMLNEGSIDFYNGNGHATHTMWDQITLADCDLSLPNTWSFYFTALRYALLGCSFNNQGAGSHTVRQAGIGQRGFISNCDIKNNGTSSPAGNHCLKIHGPTFSGDPTNGVGAFTEKIVVSDNKINPSSASVNNWTCSIEPQDSAEDERLRNIIFERNWLTAGTNTVLGLTTQAVLMTIRNNLYNGSGGLAGTFVFVSKESSGAPAPNNYWIYNNTLYSSSNNVNNTDSQFIMIDSTMTSGGATIKNNLGFAPAAANATMIADAAASIKSNNSTDPQVRGTSPANPSFANNTPSVLLDFKILTGSYAKNAGGTVPVFVDAFDIYRPQTTLWDLGFSEFDAGTVAPWINGGGGGGGGGGVGTATWAWIRV